MGQHSLHQIIFGYSNGHKLLASSKPLSFEAERLLLQLTDLSGPRLVEGFESYYSGYPLPRDAGYAFAKTWYANEVDRPGSVWTHVLILDRPILEILGSLDALLPEFKRPESRTQFEYYKRASEISLDRLSYSIAAPHHRSLLLPIVKCLYADHRPAVLEACDGEEFSRTAFGLWSQQPPLLRARFTFCTGALESLQYAGEPFAFQVMPQRSARLLPDGLSIVSLQVGSVEKWVRILADDLAGETETELRRFLRSYFDMPANQQSFWSSAEDIQRLSRVFLELEKDTTIRDIPELVNLVAHEFPSPDAGLSLKQVLFGSSPSRYAWIRSDPTFMRYLAQKENASAFDPEALQLYAQATDMWRQNCFGAAALLVDLLKEAITPVSERLLEGLIDGISLQDLMQTTSILGLPGISTIAERSTRLVTNPDFWRLELPREWHVEIAEGLCRSGHLTEVLRGIIDAGRGDLLLQVLHSAPSETVPALLTALNTKRSVPASSVSMSQIIDALRPYAEEVRQYIGQQLSPLTASMLLLVTFVLRPDEREILSRVSVDDWLGVLTAPEFSYASTHVSSFLLSVSLQNLSERSYKLAEYTFAEVHAAAEGQRIGYDNWSLLRPFLPELSWLKNWDKCERLRRGLCSAYIKYLWPPESLLNCASDDNVFRDLFTSCLAVEGGLILIQSILRLMDGLILSYSKRKILEDISRSGW